MTENDTKKRAHTAASLEQLEHPAEKKGAPKVTGLAAGSELKKNRR